MELAMVEKLRLYPSPKKQALRMRGKLVLIFILIKVLPLMLLAWLAWNQSTKLVDILSQNYDKLANTSRTTLSQIGILAINDSVRALDERARNEIERLTTDTASQIAQFLYARDDDIKMLANLVPNEANYRNFISHKNSYTYHQSDWYLSADASQWLPRNIAKPKALAVSSLVENDNAFHSRPAEISRRNQSQPLYLEASFISPTGQELYKVTSSDFLSSQLRDVSKPENTFIKAEGYFAQLAQLKAGEIYVSEVIGAYLPSRITGAYTPAATQQAGIDFEPHESAFAGKENPVGRKFRGLVRWATPVLHDGELKGYVTLALDHRNIMAFTDTILPTAQRYISTPDASQGNYAFMWDYKGRNIAHPRHYFITGYDPQTGQPEMPWLEQSIYDDWQASGLPYAVFVEQTEIFRNQSLKNKPASQLGPTGKRALDCRFLNFAPQCQGWFDLTKDGGSGSFVIFWSGLWKLSAAAAIPYFTGQYGTTKRGFGFVTVGANVDDFHEPAIASRQRIDDLIAQNDGVIIAQTQNWKRAVAANLRDTANSLAGSTLLMMLLVIIIAVWMASYLTGRILQMIKGVTAYNKGTRFRFAPLKQDEMGELASALDSMADQVDDNLAQLKNEIAQRQSSEQELREAQETLEEKVVERTRALTIQIKQREKAELRIRYLADHDVLTGLPNRRGFNDQLSNAILRADSNNKHVALLSLDLDRFKEVNDTLGHGMGDQLLCFVSDLLKYNVRKGDLVSRIGGDEFAIIMADMDSYGDVSKTSVRVLKALSEAVNIDGHEIQMGISMGITLYPQDKASVEDLILQADLALYQAKEEGGRCSKFFDPKMQQLERRKVRFEHELSNAFLRQEFILFYQPKFDYQQQKITGVEALVRWQHPQRGLLLPDDFLAAAQRSGFMPELENWVLNQTCQHALGWLAEDLNFGRVAYNVCSNELQKDNFVDSLLSVLSASGLEPQYLEIEITERSLFGRFDAAVVNLNRLRTVKISVAIDDLGVENSSLRRLIECPIDVVKIDSYFIQKIGEKKSEAVIIALIGLAHKLGLCVIAEGVETSSQLQFLQTQNCHTVQGYYHAKPMPEHEFRNYLSEQNSTR
jgi:diguanylate cyclase (GGDEF)-like protein